MDEVTVLYESFRDSGGTSTISIGGWRILGYRGTRGDEQSRLSSKHCGSDLSPLGGMWRRPDHEQKMSRGGLPLLINGSNRQRNWYRTLNQGTRQRVSFYRIWPHGGTTVEGGDIQGSGRRYMCGVIVPVRRQRPIDGGIGTHMILRLFSPMGLIPLFTGGWSTE